MEFILKGTYWHQHLPGTYCLVFYAVTQPTMWMHLLLAYFYCHLISSTRQRVHCQLYFFDQVYLSKYKQQLFTSVADNRVSLRKLNELGELRENQKPHLIAFTTLQLPCRFVP